MIHCPILVAVECHLPPSVAFSAAGGLTRCNMAENSKIEWTNHTFNPWRGCTKIAPGCANCYADAMSKRNPKTLGVWGDKGTRVVASEAMWREPLKWDRLAKEAGERHRVFCASLADVFEDWQGPMVNSDAKRLQIGPDGKWFVWDHERTGKDADGLAWVTMDDVRRRLFALIDATPNLDWLLVTKRPQNVRRMWPEHSPRRQCAAGSRDTYRSNVWLLTSISDQATADAMIPHLLGCRDLCPVLGLSAEPLLGPVDLIAIGHGDQRGLNAITGEFRYYRESDGEPVSDWGPKIDWVIIGGESGPGARPYDLAWPRSIIAQCRDAGGAVFHKQTGSVTVDSSRSEADGTPGIVLGIKDKKGGDMAEWEPGLRVREYPKTKAVTT